MPKHHCDAGDFSRMVCPEPCGTMHSYCSTCGSLQDECPNAGLALIPPQRCAPSEDELAKAVTSGWVEGFDEFGKYGPQFDSALAARAVLALFGDQLRARADSRYTYGVWTRHDGQKVPYREDALALDPDEALRFHAFPAECGCYPLNTDNREWACEHGATWSRGSMEPYGKHTTGPIYPYGGDR